jgi:hypothetical protein
MEEIMSKTNDISKFDHANLENRVLADSELDGVNGGAGSPTILGYAAIAVVHAVFEGVVLPVMNTHL